MECAPFGVSMLKCGSIGRRTGKNFSLPFPAGGCRGKASPVVGATLAVARPWAGAARPGGRALQIQFRIRRRGQAPALQVGKLPWREDTWGRPHSPPEPVGAHSMRPPGFAPGAPGDREGRPYGDIRTGSVGSANSGAELEAHRKQILQTQGPVARREIRHSLKFCAPEMAQYLSGGAPVNGVLGARLGAPERCSSEQTPAAFW